ncbi:hypothetical protein JFL43_16070 [Viridibacillus sp. YIM B01967]|uniref:Uncharacterized protein n=1 Tax=Viridibacillus soli TaxID=2798301 RepID=A0ABS1HAB6_9BACL|nr:hypothetical protein [Viridibacillus soli]MBK3496348.1 hypothetical protein [Viridibacillus soli]
MTETGYIENNSLTTKASRENSRLSYPLKDNFPVQSGSLFIKITAPDDFEEIATVDNKQMIFRTDDKQLQLSYQSGSFHFSVANETISYTAEPLAEEILVGWNGTAMGLSINGESVKSLNAELLKDTITQLIFAEEDSIQEPIILEEWALYHNKLEADVVIQEVLSQSIMSSLFEGGISGQNVTWSEIPVAPIDHSPIFVQKDSGETLHKKIVYQEGNRYGDPSKLATMIDINPIQNQNHEGFLYVTNTTNKTRITATPDRLHADGASSSTLIIKVLEFGNH